MFAVVLVPNFALQSLLRQEPDLRQRPVALVETADAHSSKALIVECTRAAEEAGVCAGFTAPQAQARCRELVLRSRSLAAEQGATEILIQTAYAFSPNIENTAPGICTIDLRGLNFDSEATSSGPRSVAERSLFATRAANDNSAQGSLDFTSESPAANSAALRNADGGRNAPDELKDALPSLGTPPRCPGAAARESALFETWSNSIIHALQKLGLEARIGLAVTPGLALLAARAAPTVRVVQQVDEFLDSLPFAALEPTPRVADVVKRWGIRSAGAFLDLGPEAVSERLGMEALELFRRASTRSIRPLTLVVPADAFEEQMDFEVHIETIEPLLFVLRRFVEQLVTRITLTYRVVGGLELTLMLESGPPYERVFKVPAPTANVETLFRMLHTHLENLRTESPVRSLRLAAMPVRAEGQQFTLFASALRDPNHFHETLARLVALLGVGRVGTPVKEQTHLPDAFRVKTPEFGEVQTRSLKPERGNPSGLCLRRFRTPIHADVEMKNGEPAFISTLLVSARIKRTRGPWCLSGTWWDERRWSRQEWDVETEKGELYRLRNVNGDWVLEGAYD